MEAKICKEKYVESIHITDTHLQFLAGDVIVHAVDEELTALLRHGRGGLAMAMARSLARSVLVLWATLAGIFTAEVDSEKAGFSAMRPVMLLPKVDLVGDEEGGGQVGASPLGHAGRHLHYRGGL